MTTVILSRILSANEVLDNVCALLPPDVPHEPVRDAILEAFGGQRVYFPRQARFAKRNAEICAEFCGSNWKQICIKYRISRRQLYRIVTRAKIFKKM